jgi:tetratricopeptide (TPR) repeat protein
MNSILQRAGVAALLFGATVIGAGCHSSPASPYEPPPDLDAEFQEAANRPPTAETLYRLGRLLAAEGKEADCERVLLDGIDRYPSYLPLYSELAQLYVRQRKLETAISTLNNGLAVVPNDAVLLNNLGMCGMLKGDYAMALQNFTLAAAADPDDARYTANMALAAGMLGNYEESLVLYMRVVKPARAHYNLAVVCEALGDQARADAEYATALELDPWMQRVSMDAKGGLNQKPYRRP